MTLGAGTIDMFRQMDIVIIVTKIILYHHEEYKKFIEYTKV